MRRHNFKQYMARKCDITGKSSKVTGGYSNRVRATQYNPTGNKRKYANIQTKKVFVPETGETLKLNLSTRAIKTINKNGAYKTLKKAGLVK